MSELNLCFIEELSEMILDNLHFDDKKQLNQFIKELKEKLLQLYDPNYEDSEDNTESETDNESADSEVISISKDSEGFLSLN